MRRSVHTLLALLLCLAAPAAHAGRVEDRDGKTVIHLKLSTKVFPDPSKTETATRADVAAVREFARRFPRIFAERYRDRYKADPAKYGKHNWDDVSVELHRASGIQVEGVETALLAIAGKVSPDVFYVNFRQSDTYIQQAFLYPLDKPEDGYFTAMTEEEKNFRIHPRIWPVIDRKGLNGEKHVWAIPWGGAVGKVVWYRKDLFDAAGIPYPTNDWTWDDMYRIAKTLTNPAKGTYGIRFGQGKHESWYWITYLWSAGAEVMVYNDETDTWKAVFDSREAAVALDYYTRLCTEPWTDKEGKQRFGYAIKTTEADVKWDRGEIGMHLQYIDEKVFATLNPDVTGMVPVPLGPTGMRGGELNSRMMGLYAEIKSPVVRDAAWEYMKFFDSKDAMAIKTRIMVEGGLGRFVNPRYLKMFGYGELIRLAPKGWSEIFEIAIKTGKPEPYGKDSNYAYDILTIPLLQAEEMAMRGELPEDTEERLDVLQGLLHDAVVKANEVMLGVVAPEERAKRRVYAILVLIAIVVSFGLVFRKVIRAFTPPPLPGGRRRGWEFRRYRTAYLLLLPAVLTVFFWQYIPLVRGSLMAFMDYRILGGSTWVWLDNFGDVLASQDWWAAIFASLRYSLLVIGMTFLPPVILAILLQEVPRGKILFRTIFYLPAVITGLVVILLWRTFYDPNEVGMLNNLVMRVPAIVFLVVGLILCGAAMLFVQRLAYHGSRLGALVFAAVGLTLLGTMISLTLPIFQHAGVDFLHAPLASVPRLFVA
ncbi:extracellular solute-binding protein, partial [bacterium]|nr:extracellular solute-binding protein [bacterium]